MQNVGKRPMTLRNNNSVEKQTLEKILKLIQEYSLQPVPEQWGKERKLKVPAL